MKYMVIQKHYNNGMISANSVKVDDNAKNYVIEKKGYDEYGNVFDNPVEAEEFRQQALTV